MIPVRQFFMVACGVMAVAPLIFAELTFAQERNERRRGGFERERGGNGGPGGGFERGSGRERGRIGNPNPNPRRGPIAAPPVATPAPGRDRRSEFGDHRRRAREDRNRLRRDFNFSIGIDRNGIHVDSRWGHRYNRWARHHHRPHRPVIGRQLRWYVPMPVIDAPRWSLSHVESIALNLESLSRDMYRTLAHQGASPQFLRLVGQLAAAAENYQDSVERSYDFSRQSLYDLFYLDEALSNLESNLGRFPRAYLIADEVSHFRYYVDELLWLYRARN